MKKVMTQQTKSGLIGAYLASCHVKAVLIAFSLILFAAVVSQAQTIPTASISGIVSDPSGAVVPGVKVTVTDIERGVPFDTQANQSGVYLVKDLIPSIYKITAVAAGFRTYVLDSFPLNATQQAVLNISLQLGTESQRVEVLSKVQMVEPSNATLGGLIQNKQIVDLPLVNRNVLQLIAMEPGVAPSTPNNFAASDINNAIRYSFNGGLESTSDFQLDGVSVLDSGAIGANYELSVLPSVDSVQEMQVQTNDYSASYGRSGGGILTMVTKSGTNAFHGSGFEFVQNTALESNNFFSNLSGGTLTPLHFDQYGGSIGGPVIKDKTFFFVTYERNLNHSGRFSYSTVPTAAERQGDFSQDYNSAGKLKVLYNPFSTQPNPASPGNYIRTAIPGNILTNLVGVSMDPVALKVASYYPLPNLPGTPISGTSLYTTVNDFGANAVASSPQAQYDMKIDHNFSSNKRGFIRYDYRGQAAGAPNPWNNIGYAGTGPLIYDGHNGVLGYTQVFGAKTVLDLRVAADHLTTSRNGLAPGFNTTTELGMQPGLETYEATGSVLGFPGFTAQGYSQVSAPGAYMYDSNTLWTASANLSRVVGIQTLTMGGEARYYLGVNQSEGSGTLPFANDMTQGPNARTVSAASGDGFASELLGTGDNGGTSYWYSHPAMAFHYYAQFVQDDIKWTRKLTTNFGFRLEEQTGQTERYNRMAAINPLALNPMSNQVKSPFTGQTPWNVYGAYVFAGSGPDSLGRGSITPTQWSPNPRFGFAYLLNDKTVIRGGYGIFFAIPFNSDQTSPSNTAAFTANTPWVATLDGITPSVTLQNAYGPGTTFVYPTGSSQGLLTAVGTTLASAWPQILRTPYNQQWNLTIQRSLSTNMLLQVAYAGNKGTHVDLYNNYQMDELPPSDLSQGNSLLTLVPNPFAGLIAAGGTLNAATVPYEQLLRPYPLWTRVTAPGAAVGDSEYEALQVMLQKRFAGGNSFVAGYTWDKLMSDVEDGTWIDPTEKSIGSIRSNYCLRCEHAVSGYDVPHRFTFSGVGQLPVGRGKRWGSSMPGVLNQIVGGWQANAILTLAAGQPLLMSVAANNTYSEGGGEHPNLVPGVSPIMGKGQSLNEWFNTAAFAQPANFTFGNLGRTFTAVHEDWTRDLDLSLFKNFNIKEKAQVQFRAEAFNFTNTPIMGAPNTSYNSGSFGVVSGQSNMPRTVQLGLKFIF